MKSVRILLFIVAILCLFAASGCQRGGIYGGYDDGPIAGTGTISGKVTFTLLLPE